MNEYDENEAIAYIRSHVEGIDVITDDDQILNLIDIIFDWQEEHGFLDLDCGDEDDDIDLDALEVHARKMLVKDKGSQVPVELIRPIIEAELDYESTIG